MYATELGLCTQDLVCTGRQPFQTVTPSLACVHRKEWSNELGELGRLVRTYSYDKACWFAMLVTSLYYSQEVER